MTTLDPSLRGKAVILAKLNAKNGTNYQLADVTISAPRSIPNTPLNGINTTVSFGFVNIDYASTLPFYYGRYNLSDIIFQSGQQTVIDETALDLYSLLPKINAFYGTIISEEDVYNAAIPAYDPQNYTAVRQVTIQAKPDSYIYTGSIIIQVSVNLPDETTRAVIVHQPSDLALVNQSIRIINKDGDRYPGSNVLFGVSNVTAWSVTDVYKNLNSEIILTGTFSFTYTDINNVATAVTAATYVVLNMRGEYLRSGNTNLYGTIPSTSVEVNAVSQLSFAVNSTTGALVKLTATGAIDSSFTPPTLPPLAFIRIADHGKIYAVTQLSGRSVSIIRLNSDGHKDTSFTDIVITTPLGASLYGVVDVLPKSIDSNTGNGGSFYILPPYGVASTVTLPTINGQAIFTPPAVSCGWNPIIPFSEEGIVNVSQTLQPVFSPTTIYSATATQIATNKRWLANYQLTTLNGSGGTVAITNKTSPVTGYVRPHVVNLSRSPVHCFLDSDPNNELEQPQWSTISEILPFAPDFALYHGQGKMIAMNYASMEATMNYVVLRTSTYEQTVDVSPDPIIGVKVIGA